MLLQINGITTYICTALCMFAFALVQFYIVSSCIVA